MLFLCKKFGNALPGLNHVVFYNPIRLLRSIEKIVQMPKTWLSKFMQVWELVQKYNMVWNIKIAETKQVGTG